MSTSSCICPKGISFHPNIDNRFRPDSFDCGTADMRNPNVGRKNFRKQCLLLSIQFLPLVTVLWKHNRKQLPQFLQRHLRQMFRCPFSGAMRFSFLYICRAIFHNFIRINPACCLNKSSPGRESDIPAWSCNRAEIPKPLIITILFSRKGLP